MSSLLVAVDVTRPVDVVADDGVSKTALFAKDARRNSNR